HLPPADVIDLRRQCSLRPDLRERLALEEALGRVSALSSEPEKAASIREPEGSPASDGLISIPRPSRGRTSPLLLIGVAASLIVILLGSTIYLAGQLRSERRLASQRESEWHKRDDEQRGTIAEFQKHIQSSGQPGRVTQRSTEATRPDPQNSGVGP